VLIQGVLFAFGCFHLFTLDIIYSMKIFGKIFGGFYGVFGAIVSILDLLDFVEVVKIFPEPPEVNELIYGHIVVFFLGVFMSGMGVYIFMKSR
jgi:hypothetical protein